MVVVMAKRRARGSEGKESRPPPSDEEGGLSARMRELILRSQAEERRMGRDGADDADERRRRGDRSTESANPDS
jgi:hypothetical protein